MPSKNEDAEEPPSGNAWWLSDRELYVHGPEEEGVKAAAADGKVDRASGCLSRSSLIEKTKTGGLGSRRVLVVLAGAGLLV